MQDPNDPCIFCNVKKEELQFENKLAYSSTDSYPVSKFHSLIVPKRHVQDYFDLSPDEVQACHANDRYEGEDGACRVGTEDENSRS